MNYLSYLMQSPGIGRGLTELITTGSYQTIDLNCFGVERVLSKKERIDKSNKKNKYIAPKNINKIKKNLKQYTKINRI